MIDKILYWIRKVTEVGLCLIALSVVAEILFGVYTPFFPPVIENILFLVGELGQNGLIGLVAIGILWAIYTRNNEKQLEYSVGYTLVWFYILYYVRVHQGVCDMKELEPFSKEWLDKEIRESYPACIGTAKIRWRVYECWNWNDKKPLKRLNILWSLIPFKYLKYNRKGIYIQWC